MKLSRHRCNQFCPGRRPHRDEYIGACEELTAKFVILALAEHMSICLRKRLLPNLWFRALESILLFAAAVI